tara:strand:+ start:408 stop:1598 length:1191 start_codon:yes stop_codon:yes gene_type:complete
LIALGVFPLFWFLSQAILFRELTKILSRPILILLALLVGSSFIFILYFGMNKLISYAPQVQHEGLYGAMFVGPAIFLLFLFLFYPAIRTFYFSFFDKRGQNFIGFENYIWSFTDEKMLITIRNQFIWLIGVVVLVIFLGLVVGYISDRLKKGESFFKSIIFMPMAISAVGSSAIFKFIYEYRPPPSTQIGLINGLRVGSGNDIYGNPCGNNAILEDGTKIGYTNEGCLQPIGWLQQRDLSGIPSFENISNLDFFSNIIVNFPINTFFLMLVMVWMFTGFAMVVFSAAIKAIPGEIIEAGQMDGATEGKIFLSIVIPYLKTTILVVATYLTVSVLKAFDIVYVTTRGDFETNLLAVKMLDEFAIYLNQGRSATVAVLIFVCVIPVILLNILKNKEEV